MKLLLDRKEVNPNPRAENDQTLLVHAAESGDEAIVKLLQGHIDAESGTEANDAPMPPSHLLETSYERLAASQPPPQPPRVAPAILTQNTHAALTSAVSPLDTPDTNSEISSQAPPLDSPPPALPNPIPRTAIVVAGIATAAAILAITIRRWLLSRGSLLNIHPRHTNQPTIHPSLFQRGDEIG